MLPVPQEPTTFRNKEDIKRLNDWRNEFGRGVRRQSARNSFTKEKVGTLPFYMYTSADANDSTEEQALTSIQELFKALNSEKDADTPMHPKGNNCRSDVKPVPRMDMITRRISHHILKFTQSNANPTFSPSSFYEASFPCLDMITRRINHHILKFTQSNANPTFSPSSFYVR